MQVHFECDKCDVMSESLTKLKSHVSSLQMKTFSTQTEENVVLEDKSVQYNRDELESDKI